MNFYGMDRFGLSSAASIMDPADLGVVNGQISLNGWHTDIAAVKGLYAPPVFSDNFDLNIRFNGRRIYAKEYFWMPVELVRKGESDRWQFLSRLTLAGRGRAAMLEITAVNGAEEPRSLTVQYEIDGGVDSLEHWPFSRPSGALQVLPVMDERGQINIDSGGLRIAASSSLPLHLTVPGGGTFESREITVPAGGSLCFSTAIAAGTEAEADALAAQIRTDSAGFRADSMAVWENRVRAMDAALPSFDSSNETLKKLYDRSLLHLLLNEWRVEGYPLQPYHSTGGINGGCFCCYLWNYGEPYRLWSMLDPAAARAHLKAFLSLDLTDCYAFYPGDLAPYGPYYPVNQEKVIFLAHAYISQTGDINFLYEDICGKSVLERLLEEAFRHDDLSREAVLVDYGPSNSHLELRREFHYNGIMPDLNLRRCVNYRLMDEICKAAGHVPPADMVKRAEALKKLVHEKLYDPASGWFRGVHPDGTEYISWTMQIFKTLGWGDWALTAESSAALISHLNEDEFIGRYGMHSLAKHDPYYDRNDVDNGGPGACISFAPAVADRLYRCGESQLAEKILRNLYWLAEAMPYWGDSQYAAMMEYRRDTPLQGDIQGAALAQSIIFGMFGVSAGMDGKISVSPHLPEDASFISLKGLRLCGKCIDIRASADGYTVTADGREYRGQNGKVTTII